MPWCPKCKTEYREGFKVCADCGSELVAEQPPEDSKEPSWEEVQLAYAKMQALQNAPVEEAEEDTSKKKKSGLHYQDSSEKASDNRSSGWMLLILGVLGLVVVILGATGVLPFKAGNPYLFYGVMGAMFVVFIVGGIVSMKNAKFFEKKAESENSLRSTLLDWCKENLDAREIDGRVGAQGVSEEILYFKRFAYIKDKMNHQFVNLEQEFLDRLIDEYIYDSVFSGKSE